MKWFSKIARVNLNNLKKCSIQVYGDKIKANVYELIINHSKKSCLSYRSEIKIQTNELLMVVFVRDERR